MELGSVLQTWQFYASAMLLGGLLGRLLFRYVPLPKDVVGHLEQIQRAGAVINLAKKQGSDSMEMLATRVGAQELAAILVSIQSQRRQMLLIGIGLALVGMALLFIYLPFMLSIPAWIYVGMALLGAFMIWKAW